VLTPAGNSVDESTKIARTREAVVGVSHELVPNLAVGVDYIYRRFDNGLAAYTVGYQPGASGFPLSQIYTGPLTYTDPVSGNTGSYYVVCQGCMRPSGLGQITMTNEQYQDYSGVDITLTKRYSDRWQANVAVTLQTNPNYFPDGSLFSAAAGLNDNPTGLEYRDGVSTLQSYVIKASGSYQFPWGIMASGNFNMNQGAVRVMTMNGPGNVYGGVNAAGAATTLSYTQLEYEPRGTTRFGDTKLLDLGLQKSFNFGAGERYRLKVVLDAFNVLNTAEVQGYASNNISLAGAVQPNAIIPPRVFRVGATFNF
jgi:hypothetical protein